MISIRISRGVLAGLAMLLLMTIQGVGNATTVRMQTSVGPIDVILYDKIVPHRVANFLSNVNRGVYVDTVVDRVVPGMVIQGGSFKWVDEEFGFRYLNAYFPVDADTAASVPSRRGTISMSTLGYPYSAASQWFINLADDGTAALGQKSVAFTVIGEVAASSMAIVDSIGRLPIFDAYPPFDKLPLAWRFVGNDLVRSNLVVLDKVTAVANDYQGLWWNAMESGWGMTITQHGDQIFSAIYTFDDTGQPIWYVIPQCPLTTNRCTGDIYKVTGGSSPAIPWIGSGKSVTTAGTGTLAFDSAGSGTFNFTINNVAGSKAITQQIFATGNSPPAVDYTDLWWNANESGWGISLTQQYANIFAAWFTYDGNGSPVWYVVPDCPVSNTECTGAIYQVSGGAALTKSWNGASSAKLVGNVTFAFSAAANATMQYTLNGATSSRTITRQSF